MAILAKVIDHDVVVIAFVVVGDAGAVVDETGPSGTGAVRFACPHREDAESVLIPCGGRGAH
jgi:hypothetical protein